MYDPTTKQRQAAWKAKGREDERRQYLLDHAPGIAGRLAAGPSDMAYKAAASHAIWLAGLVFDEINPPEGSGS